jgi:hypothetical protein
MTHCGRELLHAQWEILFDDEFLMAYEHGIVMECCDSIMRRFYLRIITHSGDYKERFALQFAIKPNAILINYRIILASIRNLGYCPCPRCLIPMSRVHNMGKVLDMKQRKTLARVDDTTRRSKVGEARDLIYKDNYAVNYDGVEELLKEQSLVPASVSTRFIHM